MASNALPRGSACLTCRKKKQKCDAGKPACTSCLKGNKVCIYEPPKGSRVPLPLEEFHTIVEGVQRRIVDPNGEGSGSSGPASIHETPSPPHASDRPTSPYDYPSSPEIAPITIAHNQAHATSRNDIREQLISIFLQNRDKCCFEINMQDFMISLGYGADDLRRPHPCLIEAMLLLGCYFSRHTQHPSPPEFEVKFLSNARAELARSYDETDRLHDFIRASNLVAFYYFCKGYYGEAYQQLKNSVYIVVACGLHQIPSPLWRQGSPRDERDWLPFPQNAREHGERILTFWQTFCFDKIMSLAFGNSPPLLADGSQCLIVTAWPRLLREYEDLSVSDMEISTVRHMFDNPYDQPQYTPFANLDAYHAQGLALVSQAAWAAGLSAEDPVIQALDMAIEGHSARLPGIRGNLEPEQFHSYAPVDPRLAYLNTLPRVASLYIHQYGQESHSRDRTVLAIQSMAQIAKELGPGDYPNLFVGIGYLWVNVCQILIRILDALGPAPNLYADSIRAHYYTLMTALKNLSRVYLSLGHHILRLEGTA